MVTHPAGNGQAQPSDSTVAHEVKQRLANDSQLEERHIVASVLNGTVTLSGQVKSAAEANSAAVEASGVPGVQSVVNHLDVIPEKRSDAEIQRDVDLALHNDPATAPLRVNVATDNATVTLSGTVERWEQKDVARWVAEQVPGIRRIRNDIKIAFSARPDRDIAAEVQRRLKGDAQVSDKLVVDVEDGVVQLSGQVASPLERTWAEADSWVVGVRHVDTSRLEVVPGLASNRNGGAVVVTDADLRQSVVERFGYDPRLRSAGIDVRAEDGVITLTGSVGDRRVAKQAETVARNTRGVRDVRNELKLQNP